MPPDPLHHPIAALTDHPVLSAEAEAALITTMLAGERARRERDTAAGSAHPRLQQEIQRGEAARAVLVRHNMRLVVAIAKRYLRAASPHLSLEDLVSFGCVGLLQGVNRFDPARSRKLSTYVIWWIRQAIGRGIAEESRVIDLPVHIHERLSQQRRARSRLTQQLGREPSPKELAAELGWRSQQVEELETLAQETLSLNAKVGDVNDRTELGDLLSDQRFDPEASALSTTLRHDLATVMQAVLSEREQRFLRTYFGFDSGQASTLEAVAAAEGLTRERVRQVIAGALQKLRADPTIAGYQERREQVSLTAGTAQGRS
jgi:RNA polymerase primary sigma factor